MQKNETVVKSFQKQKLLSVNKRWQVKLGNNFMCLYSDLQSATKWLETLRPKLGFFHFTDFKGGNIAFPPPSPPCNVVQLFKLPIENNKHHNFEWTRQGRCGFFCSLKLSYLKTMSQQFCQWLQLGLFWCPTFVLNLNDSSPTSWIMCITKTTYIPSLWCLVLQPHCTPQEQLCDEQEGS